MTDRTSKPELQHARQWVYELIQTARTEDLDKLRAVWNSVDKALAMQPVETAGDAIYENMDELVRDAARYRFLRQPGNAIV